MKTHTITAVIFILMLFSPYVRGNERIDYYFKQISIEQGLSQSSVTSLLRDHRGILWICTRSGLNSLDRNELKTYYNEKDNPASLPGNYIYHIAEDSLNNIWVSTNKGLALYSYEKDEFSTVTRELVFSSMCVTDGILLGGRKVVYKYSYATGQISNIFFKDIEEYNVSTEYDIIRMQKVNDREVLIGTREKGVFMLNLASERVTPMPVGDFPSLLAMYLSPEGNLYLTQYQKGLYCFDLSGRLLAHYDTGNSALNNNIVLDIAEKDGNLWMATDGGGINIFDPQNKTFKVIQHIPGDATSLPVNSILVLYNDRGDNLWAGSIRGGVFGIKETSIKVYKDVTLGSKRGLSEKTIISLFEDKDGMLWIGTDGGGINKYNPYTDEFEHFVSTYGDKVVSITNLSETELLVSLYSKGVFVFNKHTGRYRPFVIVDNEVNDMECFSGFMPLVHRVAKDKIYILSYRMITYYPERKEFGYIKVDKDKINSSAMYLTYSDDSVSYFVKQNELYEARQEDDSLRKVLTVDPQEVINSMCYDERGTFWLGSTQGLSCYRVDTGEVKRIETNLFSNISNMVLDKKGILWISAQNMLFSYVIAEDRFIIWGESDGFSSNEVLFMYQKPPVTDNLYLGGTSGLVRINRNISFDDASRPVIQLADVTFNGSSYLNRLSRPKSTLSVPWNYNSLKVKINLNEKDVFHKTLFRYYIQGHNNQFVESYNHNLDLPMLPPGEYTIKVSCNTKSGEWTEPTEVLAISILPPWYKKPWVISFAILLLIVCVTYTSYVIIRKKERRLKWKMKAYEQTVNEEKIRFLINISHELRTPLSLIYAPLKRLLDTTGTVTDEALKGQLSAILKQAAQMKDIINMVLDLNKPDAGFETLQMFPHSLNTWIRKIAEDFRGEYEQKGIKVTYRFDESIGEVWLDHAKTRIVLSNLLMNALKFSEPDTEITVSTQKQGDSIRVSVADQGIGLDHVDVNRLFTRFYQGKHDKKGSGIGLSYARKLIEKQGGSIGAYSNEQGATFFFELPLQPEKEGQAVLPFPTSLEQGILPEETDEPAFTVNSYSILIVEDNEEFRSFLQESLTGLFKQTYTAADGREAVEIINKKLPDVVVSDVMMPNMNGYELCRYIKSNISVSHIPVILLTARSDSESTYLGYKLGADFYLSKPFDVKILLTIIGNLLKNKECIREKYKRSFEPLSPQETTFSNADERFITKINDLIKSNLSNPDFDVKFLTDKMAMSRASLYNKMKVLTDMGVNDYINKLRIEKAMQLLVSTDYSITEVAYETGFAYQKYFSTIFKQMTGMTPSEYRKEYRK